MTAIAQREYRALLADRAIGVSRAKTSADLLKVDAEHFI